LKGSWIDGVGDGIFSPERKSFREIYILVFDKEENKEEFYVK
jgi:hypothetical protein